MHFVPIHSASITSIHAISHHVVFNMSFLPFRATITYLFVSTGQPAVVATDVGSEGNVCEEKIEYNRCMMRLAAPALVTVFDLSPFKYLCDLAGT
jgi:hypothetical protein